MTSLVIGTAAGLNPYVALLVTGAIAGWTSRLPIAPELGVYGVGTWRLLALLAGAALAMDLTLGKVRRFAWLMRRLSEASSTVAGAVGASMVCPEGFPIWMAAVGGSAGSFAIAFMISRIASHGARSARWVGMGDVPVLMGAATSGAVIIPLAVVLPLAGTALAILIVVTVASGALIVVRRTPKTPFQSVSGKAEPARPTAS